MAHALRRLDIKEVLIPFILLGNCELQWATVTWLLCDYYGVVASIAKQAVADAVEMGVLVHDRGYLRLPKIGTKV